MLSYQAMISARFQSQLYAATPISYLFSFICIYIYNIYIYMYIYSILYYTLTETISDVTRFTLAFMFASSR